MLIGVDDISNDDITLGTCFPMFVPFALVSASRWLAEIWQLSRRRATDESEVELKFQRRSCKLTFLFPLRRQSAPESLLAGYLALGALKGLTWFRKSLLFSALRNETNARRVTSSLWETNLSQWSEMESNQRPQDCKSNLPTTQPWYLPVSIMNNANLKTVFKLLNVPYVMMRRIPALQDDKDRHSE